MSRCTHEKHLGVCLLRPGLHPPVLVVYRRHVDGHPTLLRIGQAHLVAWNPTDEVGGEGWSTFSSGHLQYPRRAGCHLRTLCDFTDGIEHNKGQRRGQRKKVVKGHQRGLGQQFRWIAPRWPRRRCSMRNRWTRAIRRSTGWLSTIGKPKPSRERWRSGSRKRTQTRLS